MIQQRPQQRPQQQQQTYQQYKVYGQQQQKTGYPQQKARKVIENYSYGLDDQIGKGFSSKVFSGRDETSHEPVAIKVIDLQMLKSPLHIQLLQSEIEALSQVKHENVMKLFKVFQTSNNTYLITEFCEGGDLASLITKLGHIPELQVQTLMYGIIQGYKELKKRGIIHRDLKPANILMSKNGIPKIADFGFATTPKSPPMLPHVNVGSPLYMSPQALKQNRYSDKSDIWAIGVSIYEMLHAKYPWQANNEKELANKLSQIPAQFGSIKLSHECIDFIQKCLIVDETKRIGIDQMEQHPWIARVAIQINPQIQIQINSNPPPAILNQNQNQQNTQMYPLLETQNNKELNYQINFQVRPKTDIKGKENSAKRRGYLEVNTSLTQKTNDDSQTQNSSLNAELRVKSQSKNQNSIGRQSLRENKTITERISEYDNPYQIQDNQEDAKRNDIIILAQINFCRYLHRVSLLLEKVKFSNSKYMDEKIQFLVNKNIMMKMQKLKDITQNLNTLNLYRFQEYSQGNSFTRICSVIQTYLQRYSPGFYKLSQNMSSYRYQLQQDKKFDAVFDENLTEFESFYIILQSIQRLVIRELVQYLDATLRIEDKDTDSQLPIHDEDAVVLLDYLVTYFQLTILILDQFNKHEVFASQSKIEQIADGKPVRLTYSHFVEIRNKIQQLEI